MAQTPTPTATTKKHLTKEERAVKFSVEDKIKGKSISARPPARLNQQQKKVYKWLFKNLEPTQLLSQLDVETLCNACFIIERLNRIDEQIDADPANLTDKALLNIRSVYFSQYLSVCRELCLSPAARAKMGSLALSAHKKKTDPLLKALEGGLND